MGDSVPGPRGALWGDSQGEPDGDASDEYWDDYAPNHRRRAGVALALIGAAA